MGKHSICGYATRARHSPVGIDPITGKPGYTEAARKAADSRFWDGIPESLPEAERQARYHAARAAFYAKFAENGRKARAATKNR